MSGFQFPLSERTNCNASCVWNCRTRFRRFQFPLSERTNCNNDLSEFRRHPILLSVSSIGTNELQRRRIAVILACDDCFQFPLSERTNCNAPNCARARPSSRTFSFLYRNERTATRSQVYALASGALLSVSSIGTNELQPPSIAASRLGGLAFQFPLSERTNCN